MPASSSETRARWRKRKRDQAAARRSKLKEHEEDAMEDIEEEEDADLDPPNHLQEGEDDPQHHTEMTHISGERESEKLVDGGVRICDFPIAIRREVNRPHSSVFRIVDAERSTLNGGSSRHGQGGVPMLENISHGQRQVLSAVPRDSPILLGYQQDEAASCSGAGSYVIAPPRIAAGSGMCKRLGSAGRPHSLPVHSEWFSLQAVHRLERQVVPNFFTGKSAEHTPEKYMAARNSIVAGYMENPERNLTVADCHGMVADIEEEDLSRLVRFLNHWGIINYCATSPSHEAQRDGTYLCEDTNNELLVPSAALNSIDGLIKFDSPKCRFKASDVYPELASQAADKSDFDSTIREHLSERCCSCCFRSIPTVYYQSQKEVDVRLCSDCFHEGGFVPGHSSLDFVKENSMKDYGESDGDSWSDQEIFDLLEGVQLYSEDWNKIAEFVGSKSKSQCILQFLRLPLDGAPLDDIEVPSTSGSSRKDSEPNSNGSSSKDDGMESKLPFSSSGNPVMHLVAFLASALGPRVAAACAHASLASLSKDSRDESPNPEEGAVSAANVRAAAEEGLIAAALKAKLFADHEEREIQRLSANIVNHQLKRLELKLKQFAEIETLLMRECEQMERARQRIASERELLASSQFGYGGVPRPLGTPGVAATATMNTSAGNSRQPQQVPGSQQPFMGGYGNNQPMHPHLALMQQPGAVSLAARMPMSTRQPSPSSASSSGMFNPASTLQSIPGHPSSGLVRPVESRVQVYDEQDSLLIYYSKYNTLMSMINTQHVRIKISMRARLVRYYMREATIFLFMM
ncbi:SWI/SNF complex subunit SWI3C-like isoform X2 [Andrographis paniculata]|uniref:SWI/SNF complex subunit SWI3C-like isoform X2 n=1 Tax=Andrographis paniculata TaxID=175694 RepID=UPI0021E6E60C|nr:SWI/SNF complex subunit SWI3C-like isoform X2 [Andrographis paniculata]